MINVDKYIHELERQKKKMEWLINGYFINCLLPNVKFSIPIEWIVKNYNVEMDYFEPK